MWEETQGGETRGRAEGHRVAFLMPREAAQVFQLQDHPGVLSWSQGKGRQQRFCKDFT